MYLSFCIKETETCLSDSVGLLTDSCGGLTDSRELLSAGHTPQEEQTASLLDGGLLDVQADIQFADQDDDQVYHRILIYLLFLAFLHSLKNLSEWKYCE